MDCPPKNGRCREVAVSVDSIANCNFVLQSPNFVFFNIAKMRLQKCIPDEME